MSHLKLSFLLVAGVLALAPYGQAQNLVLNPGFETATADPCLVCANWTLTAANTGAASTVSIAAAGGIGGSKALSIAATGDAGATSTSNGAWQIIPVVVGKKYQIHGQWKGDISVQTTGTTCNAMVEVYVGFSTSSTVKASVETCIYRKRNQYGSSNIYNVDLATGLWDWQDMPASPNLGWGGDDAVTATGPYMTLRFNFTTGVQTGTEHVYIDNVSVQGCQAAISTSDVNGDCVVNFKDVSVQAANWLTCGLTPSSMCW